MARSPLEALEAILSRSMVPILRQLDDKLHEVVMAPAEFGADDAGGVCGGDGGPSGVEGIGTGATLELWRGRETHVYCVLTASLVAPRVTPPASLKRRNTRLFAGSNGTMPLPWTNTAKVGVVLALISIGSAACRRRRSRMREATARTTRDADVRALLEAALRKLERG